MVQKMPDRVGPAEVPKPCTGAQSMRDVRFHQIAAVMERLMPAGPRLAGAVSAFLMLALLTGACQLGAEPQADPAAGEVIFDPAKTRGGIDIWRAPLLPDGSFGVPVNLGPNVNSSRRETSPSLSPDGKRLFFAARNRPGSFGHEDLYVSEWQGDGWGPAVSLGLPVNSASSEIGPCMLPDGVTLIYSRRDAEQRAYDLLITVDVEGEWLEPIPFGDPVYTPSDECLSSVTADGSELYFTGLRKSGFGSFDIFVSHQDDSGRWQQPANLGSRINSAESDYSPGISPDGQRLYFSSQRDEIGNFDIYFCDRTASGSWGEPVRMPPPVNSRLTEYCPFVAADGSLYFASDRRRGEVPVQTEVDE